MIIKLVPFVARVHRDLSLDVSGDILSLAWKVGREDFDDLADFSDIQEGDEANWDDEGRDDPRPWWLTGPVTRQDGEIVVSVKFPVETGWDEAAAFPVPIHATGGAVLLPDPCGPRDESPQYLPRVLPDPKDPTIL